MSCLRYAKFVEEMGAIFEHLKTKFHLQVLTVDSLSAAVTRKIQIKSVNGKPIGQCLKAETVKPTAPKPTPQMTKNYPPLLRNQVDEVNATLNQLLVYKVRPVSRATILCIARINI